MEKAIEILLNQGVFGAMMVIAFIILKKRDTDFIESLHERLKDKDRIIEKLLENELKTDRIIAAFSEMKPLFEQIRDLLSKWYSNKVGL